VVRETDVCEYLADHHPENHYQALIWSAGCSGLVAREEVGDKEGGGDDG
jgi:hypothetical protein